MAKQEDNKATIHANIEKDDKDASKPVARHFNIP